MKKVSCSSIMILGWLLLTAASMTTQGQDTKGPCPQISIVSPHGILSPKGKSRLQTLITGGEGLTKLGFSWGSSRGRFVSGSYTQEVELWIEREDQGSNLTVFVKVDGLPDGCPNMVSEIIPIAPIRPEDPYDEFGELSRNDMKARLDGLFVMLGVNPMTEALITIHFDQSAPSARRLRNLRSIFDAIRFRKYDIKRVSFLIDDWDEETQFAFWLMPPGADLPHGADKSNLIIGKDLMQDPKKGLPKYNCKCPVNH